MWLTLLRCQSLIDAKMIGVAFHRWPKMHLLGTKLAGETAELLAGSGTKGCSRDFAALGRCEEEINITSGGDGRGGAGFVPVTTTSSSESEEGRGSKCCAELFEIDSAADSGEIH